jgi:hypothetical protein
LAAPFGPKEPELGDSADAVSWEIGPERFAEFAAHGLNHRNYFPHTIRFLRRPGPDGYKLALRMYGLRRPEKACVAILHAMPEACREFPADLFLDDDIIWHRQHLGLPGHVAVADLYLDGRRLYTTARFSDVVQRISRRRELKTRVERVFRGWDQMLLNGIVQFAARRGVREVVFPTPDLALENTDPSRNPKRMLFERLYDLHLRPFRPRSNGRVWIVDVPGATAITVAPSQRVERLTLGPAVAIVHDTERGLGYRHADAKFAARADLEAPANLNRMLAIEAEMGVKSTYSVVGNFLEDVRGPITSGGHALAFHSYDHAIGRDQLERCRSVDYRLPGYRPPQSRITRDARDDRLLFHNFEWLASSEYSLGFSTPRLAKGLVKLPICRDDFALFTRRLEFDAWWAEIRSICEKRWFVAFGLHDCHAEEWLGHYAEMLGWLAGQRALVGLDDVANLIHRARAL